MDLLYFASAAWLNQKCPSFISPQLEVLKSWFIEFKQALHALNIAEEFQSIFIDKLGDSISRIPFIRLMSICLLVHTGWIHLLVRHLILVAWLVILLLCLVIVILIVRVNLLRLCRLVTIRL